MGELGIAGQRVTIGYTPGIIRCIVIETIMGQSSGIVRFQMNPCTAAVSYIVANINDINLEKACEKYTSGKLEGFKPK